MIWLRPCSGVILPSRTCATPKMMGYLRSERKLLSLFLMSFASAIAVSTPSATSVVDSRMSFSLSPLPSRSPKFRLRESGPKHVKKVSPQPERPERVLDRPPKNVETLRISTSPRVTSAASAFDPSPSPSLMPAASASTFLTAPPTSTPTTSVVVKTRKSSEERNLLRSAASAWSSLATTTAVAIPSKISRANEGPDRYAYDLWSPSKSSSTSHMRLRLLVSIPFEIDMTGVPGGMCFRTFLR
mmetsp:Transcript_108537/g.315681  ORF Transcript_108537/g.315681 Transcript_108537/m.315681 type:complete len:243 (-) Transcript_108537:428-1156(-)